VPGRVRVDAFVVQLGCAEGQHVRSGDGYVLHHDVQMNLLRARRIRPGRRLVIGRELERQAR
jgi:hypothetical protein